MVNHGDNIAYDFGFPLLPKFSPLANAADTNVNLFIMTMYANFARSGEPTPQQVSSVTWEKFNSSHRAYLRVDANPKMAASSCPRRMVFWNDYHPKLQQVKFETKEDVFSGASGVTMGNVCSYCIHRSFCYVLNVVHVIKLHVDFSFHYGIFTRRLSNKNNL